MCVSCAHSQQHLTVLVASAMPAAAATAAALAASAAAAPPPPLRPSLPASLPRPCHPHGPYLLHQQQPHPHQTKMATNRASHGPNQSRSTPRTPSRWLFPLFGRFPSRQLFCEACRGLDNLQVGGGGGGGPSSCCLPAATIPTAARPRPKQASVSPRKRLESPRTRTYRSV